MNMIQKSDLISVNCDCCIVIAIIQSIVYYLNFNGKFCSSHICDVTGHWNEYDMFVTNIFYTLKYE